jgi:hypothetical protein
LLFPAIIINPKQIVQVFDWLPVGLDEPIDGKAINRLDDSAELPCPSLDGCMATLIVVDEDPHSFALEVWYGLIRDID